MASTIRDLWEDSSAQTCRRSCCCPLPEHCRALTPDQVSNEVERRIGAGFVEHHENRDGLRVITYVKENQ